MAIKPWLILPCWFTSMLGVGANASEIKDDENVQLVRGIASIGQNGALQAQVSAWVYEQEDRPGIKQVFAKIVGLDLAQASQEELANYDYRTQLFRFDSERNKTLELKQADGKSYTLPATDSDGMSRATLEMNNLSSTLIDAKTNTIALQVVLNAQDQRRFEGQYIVIPASGLSVVSDIDDTIKDSNVRNHDELIRNTFLRKFKPVIGMSQWYTRLAAQHANTRFHYLSSSPHQLYAALDTFLHDEQFPLGSVHLRHIDVTEEAFGNGNSSKQHKLSTLHNLFKQFPQRHFLLIGDSGEADPEIYAEIARTYPQQIEHIYIRDVTGEAAGAERYTKTFAGIPALTWSIFTSPDEVVKNIVK